MISTMKMELLGLVALERHTNVAGFGRYSTHIIGLRV